MNPTLVERVLLESHFKLMGDLSPSIHLLSFLLSKRCLQMQEFIELREITSSQSRTAKLLQILCTRPASVDLLILYLTEHQPGQPHLQNLLIELRDRAMKETPES